MLTFIKTEKVSIREKAQKILTVITTVY